MTKVTIEEVRSRLNDGESVIAVDSRAAHAWDESNVKAQGAVRIPPDAAENYLSAVGRNDYLVTYCT